MKGAEYARLMNFARKYPDLARILKTSHGMIKKWGKEDSELKDYLKSPEMKEIYRKYQFKKDVMEALHNYIAADVMSVTLKGIMESFGKDEG